VSASTAIDPRAFRRVIGQFATGVTVITVQRDDVIHGMTANAVTSVSLDPPLVLFCVAKTTRMASLLNGATGFAINLLAADQETVSRQFAGTQKDRAVQTVELEHGPVAPILAGGLGALSCVAEARHEGGDHWIVVGRVVALHEADGARAPLVFFRSRYHHIIERELARPQPPETWENDAIRVYHAEWSEGDEPEPDRDDIEPWG
jgi:flavin reductase (DIM6/NTAB) family NADH-FMN oxidoreductase RutF